MHSYRYILKIVQVPQHLNYMRMVIFVYWVHTRNIFFILVRTSVNIFFQLQKIWERAYSAGYMCVLLLRYVYGHRVVHRGGIGQKPKVAVALLLVKRKFKVFPHKKHQGPCNDCWHVECCPRTLLDGRYVIMIREGPLVDYLLKDRFNLGWWMLLGAF